MVQKIPYGTYGIGTIDKVLLDTETREIIFIDFPESLKGVISVENNSLIAFNTNSSYSDFVLSLKKYSLGKVKREEQKRKRQAINCG